jgi:RNA polymerase sigma-B factor
MPAKRDSTDDIKRQTAELFARYSRAPSVRLRNQIATLNYGLAEKAASALSLDGAEPFEDLTQVAFIGLLKAVERFSPETGNAFSSYAMPFCKGEIRHWRRDKTPAVKIPRRWSDRFSKLRKMLEAGEPHEAIAAATKIPLHELPSAIDAMLRPGTVSLDAPAPDSDHAIELAAPALSVTQWEDEIAMELCRRSDGLIDATALAQQHGKQFHDYWRRRGRKYARKVAATKTGQNGGFYFVPRGRGHHSFVCDEIAIDLLRWCNPQMAIAVDSLAISRLA